MNLRFPSFTVLAAISYALFAAFGIAVWCTLLFVSVPKGANAWSTAQYILRMEPQTPFMQAHAAVTLIAAAFAGLLFLQPAVGSMAYLGATVTSVAFAVAAWFVFASEPAVLPTVSAVALAFGSLTHRRRPQK